MRVTTERITITRDVTRKNKAFHYRNKEESNKLINPIKFSNTVRNKTTNTLSARAVGDEPEVKKLPEKKERPEVERRRPMKSGDGEERKKLKDLEKMGDQGHDFAGVTAPPTQINP